MDSSLRVQQWISWFTVERWWRALVRPYRRPFRRRV